MPKINEATAITSIQMAEQASAPATPASGQMQIYAKSDGILYYKNDAGSEVALTASTAFDGNVTGTFALSGDITPAALGADTNDWSPTSLSTNTVIRASTSANYAVTGLQGGSDGRVVVLHNVGSFDLQLKAEDSGSTAANRFTLRANLRLFPGCAAIFQYDSTSSRWRCLGHSGAFAGEVMQTLSTKKSDTFSTSSTSWTDITGVSVAITPKSTANNVFVTATLSVATSSGTVDAYKLVRASTDINVGDTAGSRTPVSFGQVLGLGASSGQEANVMSQNLDSPAATSSTTYKVQTKALAGGGTIYLNQTRDTTDDASNTRGVSNITVQEICG